MCVLRGREALAVMASGSRSGQELEFYGLAKADRETDGVAENRSSVGSRKAD
jgi:hypothetical protein